MGKETLKFRLIFGSLPDFPSLRPYVKRERSQVALFLLCVVSPVSSTPHHGHDRDSNSSYCIYVIVNPITIRSQPPVKFDMMGKTCGGLNGGLGYNLQ